jgi:hypothetical protein
MLASHTGWYRNEGTVMKGRWVLLCTVQEQKMDFLSTFLQEHDSFSLHHYILLLFSKVLRLKFLCLPVGTMPLLCFCHTDIEAHTWVEQEEEAHWAAGLLFSWVLEMYGTVGVTHTLPLPSQSDVSRVKSFLGWLEDHFPKAPPLGIPTSEEFLCSYEAPTSSS